MTIEASSESKRKAGPDSDQQERLEQRIAELRANDRQFANAYPLAAVSDAVAQLELSSSKMLDTIMEGYADRPAAGQRVRELSTDADTGRTSVQLRPEFETVTYRELWRRAGAVAAQWHHDPTHPFTAGGSSRSWVSLESTTP